MYELVLKMHSSYWSPYILYLYRIIFVLLNLLYLQQYSIIIIINTIDIKYYDDCSCGNATFFFVIPLSFHFPLIYLITHTTDVVNHVAPVVIQIPQ